MKFDPRPDNNTLSFKVTMTKFSKFRTFVIKKEKKNRIFKQILL